MPIPKKLVKKPPVSTAEPKAKWPAFTKRFGPTVRDAGVVAVPRVLLTGLAELKLNPMQAIVLLQMIGCWGPNFPHPFPKRSSLMKWIGCDKRTLDRATASLVDQGFIKKGKHKVRGRTVSNEYDLSGLVERLKPLGRKAINERKAREARKAGAI